MNITSQSISSRSALHDLLCVLRDKEGLSVFDLDGRWTVVTWWDGTHVIQNSADWISEARSGLSRVEPSVYPFVGGWVGWIGYEAGAAFEKMPLPKAKSNMPDVMLWKSQGAILLDHWEGKQHIVGSRLFIEEAQECIAQPKRPLEIHDGPEILFEKSSGEAYARGVELLLSAIKSGDVYQANLSWQCPEFPLTEPLAQWLRLRAGNPARFGAYLQFSNVQLLSNSPERYLYIQPRNGHKWIESVPIKGTSPRSEGWAGRRRLWESEKERAELTMIVDLVRNDLGRVCQPGSIFAGERQLRRCGDLYHAMQAVRGRLRDDLDAFDALAASFPPGSVTGAPKVAAMKFINALEDKPRGVYTGAIGWFSNDGGAHLNVAIRTIAVKNRSACFHTGSGIVADSSPAREWTETLAKSNAIGRILGIKWI
jgi:para-aminobenzoate synthetase component I